MDDEGLGLRAGRCRCRSSEPAQIAFGGKVCDCELMSIAPDAAQVCLRSLTDVPGFVTLRLPGGETRSMRCTWQNGTHVGLRAVDVDPAAP